MASSIHHGRRNSMNIPPEIAELLILKNEFIKLYERDHPELQQCIQNLHRIMRTFEEDFTGSTEGSRNAGIGGIVGGTTVIAGILGLTLASFTRVASLVAAAVAGGAVVGGAGAVAGAGAVVGGAATVTAAVIKDEKGSSTKNKQLTEFKQNIETEVRKFEEKIKPMAEKMTDLNEQTEKIMRYFEKLQQDVNDFLIFVDPTSNKHNIRIEDLKELTKEMSGNIFLIADIAETVGSVRLLLDMITVFENTRALNDMKELAERPRDEEVDEGEMTSQAGKFIAGMRNAIHQLQNITDNLKKTKDKMEDFEGTA